jgi:hypothetical protein
MGVESVSSIIMMRQSNTYSCSAALPFLMIGHLSSFWSISSLECSQYFQKLVHGIDHRFRTLIRVGLLVVIWLSWLCINEKVFHNKNASVLQVIYRCTGTLLSWSSYNYGELWHVYTVLYVVGGHSGRYFSQHVWPQNLRTRPPLLRRTTISQCWYVFRLFLLFSYYWTGFRLCAS